MHYFYNFQGTAAEDEFVDLFDLYNQTDLKNNGVFDDGGCTQQLSTEDNNVLAFLVTTFIVDLLQTLEFKKVHTTV